MTLTVDDKLESLSNRLRAVQDAMASLKQEETDLKARIALEVGDRTGTIQAHGKDVLEVAYPTRFNAAHALDWLTAHMPDVLPAVTETTVSSAKAKAVLAPAIYEQLQVRGTTPSIKPKAAR